MSEEKILGRKEGGVGYITFNNPAKHNAVSLDMWVRFAELLEEYEADASLRVLVINGAGGKAFVSGADISKFESERATKEAVAQYGATSAKSYDRLLNFSKPTIAKINGYCIGGGMNLAVACDLRFCEEGSRFAIPAAKLGLGYGYYGVARLSRLVGISRAMEMFYTARQFPAQEAYEMGLINKVVPVAELDDGRRGGNAADLRERAAHHCRDQGFRDRDRQSRRASPITPNSMPWSRPASRARTTSRAAARSWRSASRSFQGR